MEEGEKDAIEEIGLSHTLAHTLSLLRKALLPRSAAPMEVCPRHRILTATANSSEEKEYEQEYE